ncbi:MAG TPA: VOC family protein [Acidimicrobiales bacterium]|nr:VOC family protein [Acidimicrobiales bacterium]
MISDIDLDHVAVAAERQADTWPRWMRDLGATWVGGGATIGFSSAQVQWRNGMRLEVLEPHLVDQNDFLRRFLDHTGPGPHHLTFKVADLRAALTEVEAGGYTPVNVSFADPMWMEAFLHPKASHGVVVQLAQSGWDPEADWDGAAPPADLPASPLPRPADLLRVVHLVADLDAALALFTGVLAGTTADEGDDDLGRYVELAWPGPGRVRLVSPRSESARAWLGTRPGRVHHLRFAVDDPAAVPDAVAIGEGRWEVPPEQNLGTRLVLETG